MSCGDCCAVHATLQRPAAERFVPLPAVDLQIAAGARFETDIRNEGYPFLDVVIDSTQTGTLDVFERKFDGPRFPRTRPAFATVADVDETGAAIQRLAVRIQVNGDVTRLRFTNTGGLPTRFNMTAKADPI